VTRLRLDAAPLSPCSIAASETDVVVRKVGKRLPTLKALIDNPYTPGTVVLQERHGHGDYTYKSPLTLPWYHTGLPAVPIRWVCLTLKLSFNRKALCTDTSAQPIQILHWFRYSLATRSHLGSSSI